MPEMKTWTANGITYDIRDQNSENHIKNTDNPHGVTADQIGARPSDWTPTAEDVGAAPTGYGLGESASQLPVVDDANNVTKIGWYRVGAATLNYELPYGIMRVESASSESVTQTVIQAVSGNEVRRQYIDGAWTEWLPMTECIGAATTEEMNTAIEEAKTEISASTTTEINAAVKKAAPWNLLDNSDFRNPVNQRGNTEYNITTSGGNYTIDRWRTVTTGTVHRLVSNGLEVSGTTAVRHSIQTSLENPTQYVGKTLTLAAYIEENNTDADLQLTVWYGKGAYYQSSSSGISKTIPAGTTGLVCVSGTMRDMGEYTHANPCIRISNGIGSIVVSWMALYEGEYTSETLPAYQPKGYGAELAECQRYYLPFRSAMFCGIAFVTASTTMRVAVPTPSTMRVIPSIVTDSENFALSARINGTTARSTSWTCDSCDANTVRITLTGEGYEVSTVGVCYPTGNFGLTADL